MIVEPPAGPGGAAMLAALHASASEEPWSAESLAALIASPGVFARLALADGSPAGFVLARLAADEAEILTLAVVPAARRQGLGQALMRSALDAAAAAGAGRMLLEVAADNRGARALYAGLGFVAVGRRRAYYPRPGGGADALVLARDLRP